ncbi:MULTISPECIES: DNA-binding response regulator [unclassified Streptomyces]|uniref:helix-turn-helix transcriptional regulator n=1 Tax=unclassified Streptomyces TaxID=2593676 RepID=UPI0035D6E250
MERSEGAVTEDHAAYLEQALLQARALIESTVNLHRRRRVGLPAEAPADFAGGETLDQLMARARYSISVALTGPGRFADSVLQMLADVPRGVALRVLCTAEAADESLFRLGQLPGFRLEVRVSERELREIAVVDGSAALVRGSNKSGRSQMTVVKDAAAVRALELLFAGAWSRSRKLADHLELSPQLRSEVTRDILERLRAGHTDDTAARELNVSLRTYRRHVAVIMRELDAKSRFQAGVRAVELGLLAG